MHESLLAEVTKVNKLSAEGLSRTIDSPAPPCQNAVLAKAAATDKSLLAKVLGDFGNRIKNFTEFYDITHPQAAHIMFPLTGSKTYLELLDVMDVALFAASNKMTALLALLQTSMMANPGVKALQTMLANAPVRMLKERVDREYARVAGNSNVDLDRGERIMKAPNDVVLFSPAGLTSPSEWANAPTTFESFTRLCSFENEETAKNMLWAGRLKNMGMTYQAEVYNKKFLEAKARAQATYCGFHKVGLSESCAILGKIHDYRSQTPFSKIVLDAEDPKIGSLFQLMMPSGSFAKIIHFFFGTPKTWDRKLSIAENIANMRGGSFEDTANDIASLYEFMTIKHRVNLFEYQPRLYPLHAFQILMPERIKNMIDTLEQFPDFAGKSLFDRFYVLVPGVTFDTSYFQNDLTSKYHFKARDNKMIELSSKDEAYFLLDSYLMKRGLVYPVVLGRKDGDHYFLSYWDM
jgi:hypothetical protein